MHFDAGLAASVLETGALVGSVETPPAAGIEEEGGVEVAGAALDIAEHLPESGWNVDPQAAAALVAIDPDQLHAAVARVSNDGFELFAQRVRLELRRGAEIAGHGTPRRQQFRPRGVRLAWLQVQ